MRKRLAIPLSLLAAAGGAIAFFLGTVVLSVQTARCPPDSVCDMPMIGGIGLGLLAAPLGALAAGIATYLYLTRRGRGRTAR